MKIKPLPSITNAKLGGVSAQATNFCLARPFIFNSLGLHLRHSPVKTLSLPLPHQAGPSIIYCFASCWCNSHLCSVVVELVIWLRSNDDIQIFDFVFILQRMASKQRSLLKVNILIILALRWPHTKNLCAQHSLFQMYFMEMALEWHIYCLRFVCLCVLRISCIWKNGVCVKKKEKCSQL